MPPRAKATKTAFAGVHAQLKSILQKYEGGLLKVQSDEPGRYILLLPASEKTKQRDIWFGAVITGKNYVSFHFTPVYALPELASMLSPELKKRMQGKSCFNFKTAPDRTTLEELERLTAAAADHWAAHNWL